ncbi:MAG: BspA family leucine-rich repeat surface protein [Clostridiales bacterium]|nr:BspA family leucine-rich repeat surface protein [Clostridiales bacterium]
MGHDQGNTTGGTRWVCPRCGRANGPEMLCPGCGFDGSADFLAYPTLAQPDRVYLTARAWATARVPGKSRPRRKKRGLTIAGVASVLLLSVALFAFWWNGNSDTGRTDEAGAANLTADADTSEDADGEAEQSGEPEVYSLTLDQRTAKLTEGESTTLTASVGMSEGGFSGTVQWTSSDESIVTVVSSGDLTAAATCVGSGNCYVTAEAGSCTQICLFVCTDASADEASDDTQGNTEVNAEAEGFIGNLSRVFYDDETEVYPAQIVTIAFLNTVEIAPENAQDVSRAGDGSVLAWVSESDAEPSIPLESDYYFGGSSYRYYDLYIAANGGVTISGDCSYLFSDLEGGEFRDFCFINLTDIDFNDSFYVGEVTDLSRMFYGCESLTSLDLSGWDISSVTNMSGMFFGCESLTSLDLYRWDTSSATDVSFMFCLCSSLTDLDLSGWDTSNVTDMRCMFNGCITLTSLDLSGWDTSCVTDMLGIFADCSALTSLGLSGWDTSNVTDMSDMFCYCEALPSLDLSGWDTSSVTDMSDMFSCCDALTSLNLSGWDTSSVTDMRGMFYDCSSLTEFDPDWLDTGIADTTGMYTGTIWE